MTPQALLSEKRLQRQSPELSALGRVGVASWLWQFARGLIHPFGAAISDLTVDRGILVVRIHERKISKNYLEGRTCAVMSLS